VSGHVKEHCKTPRLFGKKFGSLWGCDCGKVWQVSLRGVDIHTFKMWRYVGRLVLEETE